MAAATPSSWLCGAGWKASWKRITSPSPRAAARHARPRGAGGAVSVLRALDGRRRPRVDRSAGGVRGGAGECHARRRRRQCAHRPDRRQARSPSIAPAFAWRGGSASLEASGVYSGLGERGWNAYGSAAAGVRSPRLGVFRAEAAGRYRWSAHAFAAGTTVAEVELGVFGVAGSVGYGLARGPAGLGIGARAHPADHGRAGRGAGHAARNRHRARRRPHQLHRGAVDLRDQLRHPRPAAGFPQAEGDRVHRRIVGRALAGRALWSSRDRSRRRLGAASVRTTSWSLSATRWLTPQLALIGGAGHYAADPASSLPAGRYATLGSATRAWAAAAPASSPAAPAVEAGFTRVRRGSRRARRA